MEDQKNEINNEIKKFSIDENDLLYIGKYLDGEKSDIAEIQGNSLYYYFSGEDIYNEKRTKLKNGKDYITLINIIKEYIKANKDFIFLYLEKEEIDLIKILFNGYLSFKKDFLDKTDDILKTIKNTLPSFLSYDLFYIIYNKLSKIYRRFNLVEDKEDLFDKFCNTFDLWKLVNNIYIINHDYFCLLGKNVLVLTNLITKDKYGFKRVSVFIDFEGDFCNMKGADIDLINIYYKAIGSKVLKYEDIKKEKEKSIKDLLIIVEENSIEYIINKEYDKLNSNNNNKFIQGIKLNLESPDKFGKIEILKNYIGKIKKISIEIQFKHKKIPQHKYEIFPNKNSEQYEIKLLEGKEGIVNLNFERKNKEDLIKCKIFNEELFRDINYYGGMECFIPIIKIIKYLITTFKEKEDKIQKLIETLIDIIKQIIKFVFYSEKNFQNFKKIIVPLIAALAEINHAIPPNMKNNIYSNYVFTILYIIIISSYMPFAVKKSYLKVTELYNINKLNLNFDKAIIDVNELWYYSYEWYASMITIMIEFILLSFNDVNKVPNVLTNQLLLLLKKIEGNKNKDLEEIKIRISNYIKTSILNLNYITKLENKENNLFKNIENIKNIKEHFIKNLFNNENNLKLILLMMRVLFNFKNMRIYFYQFEEEKNVELTEEQKKKMDCYNNIFENYFNNFAKIPNLPYNPLQKLLIKAAFKNYGGQQDYLSIIFPFLSKEDFKMEAELTLSELIDFHGNYHRLMKNLFIFNKLWSNKKLFFNEEDKKKHLKYKSINYYTKNFLRPFLFPYLDYKNFYPKFTKFEIKKDFYMEEENTDDYNFNLDCPELDEFNYNFEEELFKIFKIYKENITDYDVCLVKRTTHVKGKLIILNDNQSLIKKIVFYSYPPNISKNKPCCNNPFKQKSDDKSSKLCFGALFDCPEKYMNMKITIDIKDIRMVLRKIYFYRRTAVEIYTKNKSYFLNFSAPDFSKNDCDKFIQALGNLKSEFSPIKIVTETNIEYIGYSRQFESLINMNKDNDKKSDISDSKKEGNKFLLALFDHWNTNSDENEFSTLDLLIYLNLLSNRSYNDLFQYPVFPLLFFYNKVKDNGFNIIKRKLDKHIGFQDVTEKSKIRHDMITATFVSSKSDYEQYEQKVGVPEPSYFLTHFSNNFYTSNYMVRIFPYNLIAIELQGDGFDVPNRLFFSIEESFYNISYLNTDLRELIPEFFYFPEIFLNINKINFHERNDGIRVDDVEFPKNMDNIDQEKEINTNSNDKYENTDYFRAFKFVEKMRNLLESKTNEIIPWINLIFGTNQKYNKKKEGDLYFRSESYIDYESNFGSLYNNEVNMRSVEFGLIPLQIIFEVDLAKIKVKKSIYDVSFKDYKDNFKKICKDKINPKAEKGKKEKNVNKNEIFINKNVNEIGKKLYLIVTSDKVKKEMLKEKNNKNNNNISQVNTSIFLDDSLYISYIYENDNIKIIGYKTGKIEFYQISEKGQLDLVSEFYDHKGEIIHINYNKRLNMICSSSKDGFLNVYSLPNKLITTIKHPKKNNNFGLVFLASNPFPCIIVLDNDIMNIHSYSINGFKIKTENIYDMLKIYKGEKLDIYICSDFNENGGTFKDRLILAISNKKGKEGLSECHLFRVPFFQEEEKSLDIKNK